MWVTKKHKPVGAGTTSPGLKGQAQHPSTVTHKACGFVVVGVVLFSVELAWRFWFSVELAWK